MPLLQKESIINFLSYVVTLQSRAKFRNTMAGGRQIQRIEWLWPAVTKETLKEKIWTEQSAPAKI
jgi:hypothetical protein